MYIETEYANMTLAELEAENNRLWQARQTLKEEQARLQPFLDAASKRDTAEKAAQADPALDQRLG